MGNAEFTFTEGPNEAAKNGHIHYHVTGRASSDKHRSDITFTNNSPGYKNITGHGYINEKSRDIQFTDHSAGYKHVTGYGFVDEKNSKLTFSDNSPGYKHITGYGHVKTKSEIEGKSDANLAVGAISGLGIILFLLAIPISWYCIFECFGDFPLEGCLLVLTGVISGIISYHFGLKPGIIANGVIGIFVEKIVLKNDLSMGILDYVVGFVVLAGMGVVPSALGVIIRIMRIKKQQNSNGTQEEEKNQNSCCFKYG